MSNNHDHSDSVAQEVCVKTSLSLMPKWSVLNDQESCVTHLCCVKNLESKL